MSGFSLDTAYLYDEDYLLSNMVMAANERCRALYRDYTTVSNCLSPTSIVHRFWVDPIAEESWSIAWGDGIVQVVITTTLVSSVNGLVVTNTFTNYYPDFEYTYGDELPYGYVWATPFNFELLQPIEVYASLGLYFNISGNTNYYPIPKVLMKLQEHDYTSAGALRIVADEGYIPCRTSYNFRVTTLYDELYSSVMRMMPMFLDGQPSLRDSNRQLWRWEKTENMGIWTFDSSSGGLDPVQPGIKLIPGQDGLLYAVGECAQYGNPNVGECWGYRWQEKWVNRDTGEIRDSFRLLSITNYTQELRASGGRFVEHQGKVGDSGIWHSNIWASLAGWRVGDVFSLFISNNLPKPHVPLELSRVGYAVSGTVSQAVLTQPLIAWGSTNDQVSYLIPSNLQTIAQITYPIIESF